MMFVNFVLNAFVIISSSTFTIVNGLCLTKANISGLGKQSWSCNGDIPSTPICDVNGNSAANWIGVTCGDVDLSNAGKEDISKGICNIIVQLELNSLGPSLTGTISNSITMLSYLNKLSMTRVSVHGAIPTLIGNLGYLRELSISNTDISGSIPASFDQFIYIRNIQLNDNSLNSSLPSALCHMNNILDFNIESNMLTGDLPACMCAWRNLTALRTYENHLRWYPDCIVNAPHYGSTLPIANLNSIVPNSKCADCPPQTYEELIQYKPLLTTKGAYKRLDPMAEYTYPTGIPTSAPTGHPTSLPTWNPVSTTEQPTGYPTSRPTIVPIDNHISGHPPTIAVHLTSDNPTGNPSKKPTASAMNDQLSSLEPTGNPSVHPLVEQTEAPSSSPTIPSDIPTTQPSLIPSGPPTVNSSITFDPTILVAANNAGIGSNSNNTDMSIVWIVIGCFVGLLAIAYYIWKTYFVDPVPASAPNRANIYQQASNTTTEPAIVNTGEIPVWTHV